MNFTPANAALYAAFAAAILAIGGCANVTQQQLAAVEMKADRAMTEAHAAATSASQAAATANAAKTAADGAALKADEASRLSGEAMSCCTANKDRIERMFERTMRK